MTTVACQVAVRLTSEGFATSRDDKRGVGALRYLPIAPVLSASDAVPGGTWAATR